MPRVRYDFALALWLLLFPGALCLAQSSAVTGVVRDASGVAQLGVLIQVTAADSSVAGRAFTDLRGHYLVSNLAPGLYRVQATAALFVPTVKPALLLRSNVRSVVNLTMSTLFDATSWLPAERRRADEPPDDWTWTLRSAANRPLLRMVEDGELVMVSTSATESHAPSTRGRADMSSGDGRFGSGGTHSVLTVDTAETDGSNVVMRADTGSGRTPAGVGPSTDLSAGFERQTGFASTTRMVASFQSHPEMLGGTGNAAGLQTMQLATAQRTRLGDTITIEGGALTYAVHTVGYAFAAQPFFRVVVEPATGWTVAYRMATSPDLQGFDGLNAIQPELPAAATDTRGRVHTEGGRHQEIAIARKLGRGQVKAGVYQDHLDRVALAGAGALSPADFAHLGGTVAGVADTMTASFRLVAPGYAANGFNAMLTQPLGSTVWAAVGYSRGAALAPALAASATPATLPMLLHSLSRRSAQVVALAVNGRLPATGTKLRAVYRWQPVNLLTPVDTYREFADQPFLGLQLHQALHWEGLLPPGLEASVDVTNLLAQGYRPFVSADGRTLFLSQAPRTLQAGLSINF